MLLLKMKKVVLTDTFRICLILVIIIFFILLCTTIRSEYFTQPTLPDLYFINLEHRKDRLKHILKQLSNVAYPPDKIHRIDAIKKKDGALGCGLSHIKALREGLKSNSKYIIILEDDFMFTHPKTVSLDTLHKALNSNEDWNVILLACNGKTDKNQQHSKVLNGVIDCQTTSGYVIKKKYVPILLREWEKCVNERQKPNFDKRATSIDIWWKKLQNDKWYITNPKLGKQTPSFSDIEGVNVSYGV